jgi:hypothetical protein
MLWPPSAGWLPASLSMRSSACSDSSVSDFFGLLLLFICTQVELESDAGARLFAPRAQARQSMPRAERASRRHEQTTGIKTTHVVRSVGIGLILIGFGGFLYFQLGLFDP